MLIRFTAENYRSINEEIVFSLLPGKTQQKAHHIITHPKSGIETLRIALLYGANASGKSNIILAMEFAKDFILKGVRPKASIPLEPFRLEKKRSQQPSRFEFEFIIDEQAYGYGFVADRQRVHEEWLYALDAKTESPVFERQTTSNGIVNAKFNHDQSIVQEEPQFLQFVTRGTRPNQLLLTSLIENNVQFVNTIYEWFHESLTIIFPESYATGIQVGIYKDKKFKQELESFLKRMNTGIGEVCTKPVSPYTIDFPKEVIEDALNELTSNDKSSTKDKNVDEIIVINGSGGRYFLLLNEANEIEAYSLSTRRFVSDESIDFDMFEESDGTQRLFDLFPILYDTENKVFVVDELERSLHPNLVCNFLSNVLETTNNNQLIVTTHESTLLDLSLLRRDEIWFTEKSPSGASSLYSLEDFKPRHDLDIRKGYLQGRFGAIPVFGSSLKPNFIEE